MTTSARRPYRMVARAQQRERTRRRIVAAMKEAVMTTAYPAIRLADVASSASVSAQTVHQHFASKEALFLMAVGEIGQEILKSRRAVPDGDAAAVVGALVEEYERYGDVNWSLLLLEHESDAVAAALLEGRAGHRAWLEQRFRAELTQEGARATTVDALYAATDVGTWKLLRRDLGLSRDDARSAMEALVRGVLRDHAGG